MVYMGTVVRRIHKEASDMLRFDVSMEMRTHIVLLLVMTPCSLVDRQQRYGGICASIVCTEHGGSISLRNGGTQLLAYTCHNPADNNKEHPMLEMCIVHAVFHLF
jgi:hypothetical protein